jgi:deoxycytidine triphosphate deaminase
MKSGSLSNHNRRHGIRLWAFIALMAPTASTCGWEMKSPSLKAGVFVYDHTQPGTLSEHIARNSDKHAISERTPFKLERDQFVLGITHERVHLPIDKNAQLCLAARIEGKSSRARCGLLIHFTAPTVHPGFEGRLVLELSTSARRRFY